MLLKYLHLVLTEISIIGFYDTTVFESGKNGYIFTDDKVYFMNLFEKPQKFWYDDIESMRIIDSHKKDCDRKLIVKLYDGTADFN